MRFLVEAEKTVIQTSSQKSTVQCEITVYFINVLISGELICTTSGVAGYLACTPGNMASQEIWHPRTIFPRKNGTPPGNMEPPSKSGNVEPPSKSGNVASWTQNFLGYLEPHAKFSRISGTPCKIS